MPKNYSQPLYKKVREIGRSINLNQPREQLVDELLNVYYSQISPWKKSVFDKGPVVKQAVIDHLGKAVDRYLAGEALTNEYSEFQLLNMLHDAGLLYRK